MTHEHAEKDRYGHHDFGLRMLSVVLVVLGPPTIPSTHFLITSYVETMISISDCVFRNEIEHLLELYTQT